LERREYLRVLYDCLPDKSYIRLGCAVRGIVENADGVEVKLRDGRIEKGDMVVGCDGVHSLVRNLMWERANQTAPGLIKEQEKACEKQAYPFAVVRLLINSKPSSLNGNA
jgi:2-polyprenyl-6-methoxyphenol hydroxylase-like FAD-dependent oxidoreductase